ncbi:MAG TPA: DUF4386 domain-containing protein [Gemmatimonadaceae bacterium]|nr:DUF4386 domain-containing protein [Gemmatimonadaceae bacterium]
MLGFATYSPQTNARLAGLFWLIVIAVSIVAVVANPTISLRGSPAETAASVLSVEGSYRLGFALLLFGGVLYLGVTALLYQVLKPVSGSVALFGALASLAGITVGAASGVHQLGALALLHDAANATSVAASQMQAIAQATFREDPAGFRMGMVYFGCHVASTGYLILRSNFIPKIIGAILVAGGSSYFIASFTSFLAPDVGAQLTPFVIPIALLGEGSITLWLLIKGVDVEKWGHYATVAAPSRPTRM